jgi:hypothetical protein
MNQKIFLALETVKEKLKLLKRLETDKKNFDQLQDVYEP